MHVEYGATHGAKVELFIFVALGFRAMQCEIWDLLFPLFPSFDLLRCAKVFWTGLFKFQRKAKFIRTVTDEKDVFGIGHDAAGERDGIFSFSDTRHSPTGPV